MVTRQLGYEKRTILANLSENQWQVIEKVINP